MMSLEIGETDLRAALKFTRPAHLPDALTELSDSYRPKTGFSRA
jgi:hypothetical protein